MCRVVWLGVSLGACVVRGARVPRIPRCPVRAWERGVTAVVDGWPGRPWKWSGGNPLSLAQPLTHPPTHSPTPLRVWQIASDGLKGRVITVSLADLQNNEADAYRNIKLRVEDVQGRNCLTNFYGMDLTTDKLRSLVRKWQTLIEAHVDVRTSDGYALRLFCIAFTKKRAGQVRKTAYAQSSQIRAIRRKMVEIMTREGTSCDLKDLVGKFIPEAIGKEIEKACQGIYPLQNTFVRKVKLLRAPKFDVTKLMEVHGDYTEEVGDKVERPVEDIPGDAPAEEA